VLWDRTLQDMNMLRYLLHVSPREVYVRGAPQAPPAGSGNTQVYEEVVGHVVMTGGYLVQFHDSFVLSHVPVLLELYGTNGSVVALHCGLRSEGASITLRRGNGERSIAVPSVNPYRASVANFLAAVRGSAEPLTDGADELGNLAALAALERSAHEGLVVRVKG
jgi:1,5-anhydro-D-fructose reductase (1,5-anhydro-D-mannitol-forming)